MEIIACLTKACPGWKGAVRGNAYDGIMPDKTETRPTPTLAELEAVWPEVKAEAESHKISEAAKVKLAEIDLASIRSIREWLAAQPTAPQWVKDHEAAAQTERAKLAK